jgi:small-conductance mechanosensitive channel/CRP-like cAMP-binding protein
VNRLAELQMGTGAFGVALAIVLGLAALAALPRGRRRLARFPFVLLAVHAAARGLLPLLSGVTFASKIAQFVAVFALLASIARSAFLLITGSGLARRYFRPWPKILRDVVQVLIYFGVAMVSLRAVGVEPGSLLTTSALLTAVLGLSMQETLGNLFAGLALQGQQSVNVGNWVRFADGPEGLGEVIEINWRSTHFLTNNQVKIVVPNGVMARAILKNYSLPTRVVRIDVEVLAPYDVTSERVRAVILGALQGCPGTLDEPETTVLVQNFDDSGVKYSVRYFIDDYGRREPIESEVRQRIHYAFRRAGIDFPFPHRHLIAPGLEVSVAQAQVAKPRNAPDPRLAHFEAFAGLDQKAGLEISNGSRVLFYSPGEAIVRQGEEGTLLYAIERGEVEIQVAAKGSDPVRVGKLGPGAIFGEAALLTGEARTATIVALTECELLAVSRKAFQSVVHANPQLSEKFTNLLATRMDELSQTINDAQTESRLDQGRRSDLLLRRIKSFFGSGA